jgi:ArsR family transcriptional regulator, arsenate/arsenite/antimonite-responsive transcriptional repressor
MEDAFKAIADPVRREILRLLSKRMMAAGELAAHFRIGKPTLSHHLKVLREADLISSEREGTTIRYALNTTVVQDVMAWALALIEPAQRRGRKPCPDATS